MVINFKKKCSHILGRSAVAGLSVLLLFTGCGKQGEIESMKTLKDFHIRASNLFLYYSDLDRATDFYRNTLGFELLADYKMATIFRMATTSYLILVDAGKGMHTAEEPKTVAVALLTDKLSEWFAYLTEKDVRIRSELKEVPGSAHDGFVAFDPEGYLLEFERFNDHRENERLMPILGDCEVVSAKPGQSTVPENLGFKGTVTWLYYRDLERMQQFYENVLGLPQIVDQGWAKIYQVSSSGFIGLVDESRGMHRFTEKKAVNISFIIDDIEGWFETVKRGKAFPLRSDTLEIGGEHKYQAFVGYDPGGYYMEFDKFFDHPLNEVLMKYLNNQ